jgi:hypothetical protein
MKTAAAVLALVATLAPSFLLAAQAPEPGAAPTASPTPPTTPAGAAGQVPPTPLAYKTWPEVNLNALVTDKHGIPQTVDPHGFQLSEDGAERPLRLPAAADSPISLAFLIDFSGSTFEHTAEIVSAVKTIVHSLPAESEVTVTDVSSGLPFLDVPLTAASRADLSVLDKLKPNGSTALWDTLLATEDYFAAEAKFPRRAIVIFSDGLDNASSVAIGTAYTKMEQPGAPLVYTCFVSKIVYLPSRYGRLNLKRLAKDGGGLEFEFNTDLRVDPDSAAAAAVGAKIAAAINHQSVVQFTAANTTRDGKPRKLKLQLPDKDQQVHSLATYFAPDK